LERALSKFYGSLDVGLNLSVRKLQKLFQTYREVFPELYKSCPNLPSLRTPIALTQKLWQNASYLLPGGLIGFTWS